MRYEEKQPVFLQMPRRPIGTQTTEGTKGPSGRPSGPLWLRVAANTVVITGIACVCAIGLGLVTRLVWEVARVGWHAVDIVRAL